jgi:4-hydroxy-3-methylbut-2-en-1-yl diphosphate synthase IspG/GcpE
MLCDGFDEINFENIQIKLKLSEIFMNINTYYEMSKMMNTST